MDSTCRDKKRFFSRNTLFCSSTSLRKSIQLIGDEIKAVKSAAFALINRMRGSSVERSKVTEIKTEKNIKK